MPKVSQDHLDERRDFILEAAARCFALEGFHATSMADIISSSGLSAGSVYRYFKNKDDLIAAIVERYLSTIVGAVREVSEQVSDPAQAVGFALEVISERFRESPDEPLLRLLPQIWAEALRDESIRLRGHAIYLTLTSSFEALVRRAQEQGTVSSEVQPAGMAHVMLSLVQGFLLQWMLLGGEVDVRQYTLTVRQLFEKK